MTQPRARVFRVAAAAVVLIGVAVAVALVRQAGPDGSTADRRAIVEQVSPTPQVPVIVPGRPGESAAVRAPDQVVAPDGSRYNSLDTFFVRMMIPHHEQALRMAALAPQRAGDPLVRAVAARITAAQAPEIAQFRAWLRARGLPETGPAGGHDHATMPGMQPEEAVRALAAARGPAFDRMFVDLMSRHHQGAVQMSGEVLRVGVNPRVEELATAIAIEQSIETSRMREIAAG